MTRNDDRRDRDRRAGARKPSFIVEWERAALDALGSALGDEDAAARVRDRLRDERAVARRRMLRENKRARYEWARQKLLAAGDDPTDANVGGILGIEADDPGRTIRRWRAEGIID